MKKSKPKPKGGAKSKFTKRIKAGKPAWVKPPAIKLPQLDDEEEGE